MLVTGEKPVKKLVRTGVLHTVCEIHEEIIDERKKIFPAVFYTTSYEEILNNKKIKAVVIATHASTHY